MSAFMCNDHHIAELAHFLARQDRDRDVSLVFNTLRQANVDSINARYPYDDGFLTGNIDHEFDVKRYKPVIFNPLSISTMANCSDYQSCEVDNWERTKGAQLLQQIKRRSALLLSGASRHGVVDWEFDGQYSNLIVAEEVVS